MKFIKKLCATLVFVATLFFALSYNITLISPLVEADGATVKLNKSQANIGISDTLQLKLSGSKSRIEWSTSNNSVASVNEGLVTGKKYGTAIITAYANGKGYSCTINVYKPSIQVSKFEQGIGGKTQYKIQYLPQKFKVEDITWKSSNEDILSIDEYGLATANAMGEATITASFGEYKLKRKVSIYATKQNLKDAVDDFQIDYTRINNQIVCIVKNNSRIDLTAKYQLAFYDGTGNLISLSQENLLFIFKDGEHVAIFDIPSKEFQSYKLQFVNINEYYHQINQKEKVTVSISEKYDYTYQYFDSFNNAITDTVKLFDVNIDNQSGKRVQFEACILYYKNDILVNYTKLMNYYDLDVGGTTLSKPQILHQTNSRIEIPEYDTIRIIYSAQTNKY